MMDEAIDTAFDMEKALVEADLPADQAREVARKLVKNKSHERIDSLFENANASQVTEKLADKGKAVFIS